jgi:hypothetical protein
MTDEAAGGGLVTAGAGIAGDVAVLDACPVPVGARALAAAVAAIRDARAPEIARDRNSVCHRVMLDMPGTGVVPAIAKLPRPGPQRTNDDTTFAREAAVLAGLPAVGIAAAPALIARVAAFGTHILFTTELPGHHPDPHTRPLGATQFAAILESLFTMDRVAFMHYDLKAANILVDGDRAMFIDFEFARFGESSLAFAPQSASFCADFNVSGNPHLPARSNVANFEFRTLHGYLDGIGVAQSGTAADRVLRDWLRCKSAFHHRMAALLDERTGSAAAAFARAGGMSANEASQRLHAASLHERLQEALFAAPHAGVLRVERALMAYRSAVFERRDQAARLARAVAVDTLGPAGRAAQALPQAYRAASLRILELVARSVHPTR